MMDPRSLIGAAILILFLLFILWGYLKHGHLLGWFEIIVCDWIHMRPFCDTFNSIIFQPNR
jgi:hypothetical protein